MPRVQSERLGALLKSCAVPEKYPHGVRMRYRVGCRCSECRAANTRYECERAKARRSGDFRGLVDADRARRHILKLRRRGVGYKIVSDASGVATSIVQDILGKRRRNIRAHTERRILAVNIKCRADRAFQSCAKPMRQLDMLVEEGYTKTRIARELGYKSHALQFKRDRPITVRNAARIDHVFRKLTQ